MYYTDDRIVSWKTAVNPSGRPDSGKSVRAWVGRPSDSYCLEHPRVPPISHTAERREERSAPLGVLLRGHPETAQRAEIAGNGTHRQTEGRLLQGSADNPMMTVADRMGLRYLPPDPGPSDGSVGSHAAPPRRHQIVGHLENVSLNVVMRAGRWRPVIFYGAVASPGVVSMRIRATTWWGQAARWFGWIDDLTSDTEFDRRVRVQARDREGALRQLTLERRRLILLLLDLLPNARIVDGTADAVDRRSWLRPPDAEEMVTAIEMLVAVVKAVTSDDG